METGGEWGVIQRSLACQAQNVRRNFPHKTSTAISKNERFKLGHRPGTWDVHQVSSRNRLEIARYEQYAHLVALGRAAKADAELAAALGSDYTITPDIGGAQHRGRQRL